MQSTPKAMQSTQSSVSCDRFKSLLAVSQIVSTPLDPFQSAEAISPHSVSSDMELLACLSAGVEAADEAADQVSPLLSRPGAHICITPSEPTAEIVLPSELKVIQATVPEHLCTPNFLDIIGSGVSAAACGADGKATLQIEMVLSAPLKAKLCPSGLNARLVMACTVLEAATAARTRREATSHTSTRVS